MTTLQNTKKTYENGNKELAYKMFNEDKNSNKGISFESFCNGFDKMIKRNASKDVKYS